MKNINNSKKLKGTSSLWDKSDLNFKNPLNDLFTASTPISGCAWIKTGKGLVLIDTLSFKEM